jgi:hypothetical protein
VRSLALLALLAAACGGDADDDPMLPAEVEGHIEVIEYDGLDLGFVSAQFTDAALTPELASDGTCRVYEQPCLGQVGACAAPEGYSAGTLDVAGLWRPLSIEPGFNNLYIVDGVPRDVFVDDAAVTVTAAGDDIEAFTLAAGGVEPLESELSGAELPPLGDGPASFTWTAGSGEARVRLEINAADVCHAGAHWLVLECEGADTGSLVVSSEVLEAIPRGYSGCGGWLARVQSDFASTPGVDVELLVASADWFNLLQVR